MGKPIAHPRRRDVPAGFGFGSGSFWFRVGFKLDSAASSGREATPIRNTNLLLGPLCRVANCTAVLVPAQWLSVLCSLALAMSPASAAQSRPVGYWKDWSQSKSRVQKKEVSLAKWIAAGVGPAEALLVLLSGSKPALV